nr:hypothetical protein [Tanacetum cinerariifolium]
QIGSVRVELRKVEPLLVAFNSQLKIFHSPLDDNAPVNCEPIELLTFPPPVGNSPKGVPVVVYRLLHDPMMVVSLAGKTIQDAKRFEQLVDRRHLFQTSDVRVPPSDR